MTKLTRESTVSKAPGLLDAAVGRDVMLMSLAKGSYYALDPVAAAVWQRLDAPVTVGVLCGSLTAQFDVSAEQCEADVLTFLDELQAAKLIVLAGA